MASEQSTSGSSDNLPKHKSDGEETKSMTKTDFISWFGATLENKGIADKIKSIYDETTNDIYNRLDLIDVMNDERDAKMKILTDKIEAIEVSDRTKNLILTNKKIDPINKENIAKSLKHLVGVNVTKEDIHYVVKLQADMDKLKIVFYNKATRDQVYSAKTPEKAHIYYLARDAVKKTQAVATWTTDGRVIVKKTRESMPTRIDTVDQLMKLLGNTPLINDSTSNSADDTS